MCLAIPGKVIEIFDEDGIKMGKIDYSGTVNTACLSHCGDVKVGDYVVVHAGFAISSLDEKEANITLNFYKEMAEAARKDGKDILDNPLED